MQKLVTKSFFLSCFLVALFLSVSVPESTSAQLLQEGSDRCQQLKDERVQCWEDYDDSGCGSGASPIDQSLCDDLEVECALLGLKVSRCESINTAISEIRCFIIAQVVTCIDIVF